MLYNGSKIKALATDTVCLPRPTGQDSLFFLVRALAAGEEKKGERLFPDQEPPMQFRKDNKGQPARDPVTGKVVTGLNYLDPNYMEIQQRHEDLRYVVMCVDALDKDDSLAWETEEEHGSVKYYEACQQEIQDSGLSQGDILLVVSKAIELGNFDEKAIERAAEAFSVREAAREEAAA